MENLGILNVDEILDMYVEMREEHTQPQEPFIKILQQPPAVLRYRYKSEKNLRAKICTKDNVYPAIQVVGFKGEAVVLVSCVTKDPPYRSHPHCLTGADCKAGIFQKKVMLDSDTIISFTCDLLSTLVRDMDCVLKQRKERKIDPFSSGFDHSADKSKIDLDAVRLCFQVYVEGNKPRTFDRCFQPVVSDPIINKKTVSSLNIFKLSHASAPMSGGLQVMLFCDSVDKDDIELIFAEEKGDWKANAIFHRDDVHRGCGIYFSTPKYKTMEIPQPVQVSIYLRRRSDKAVGSSVPFLLYPEESYQDRIKRKRQIYTPVPSSPGGSLPSSCLHPTLPYAKPGPSGVQLNRTAGLPAVGASAYHIQRELSAVGKSNITSVQRSLSDAAQSFTDFVTSSRARSCSLAEAPSIAVLQEPSCLASNFLQQNMGSAKILSTLPSAGIQYQHEEYHEPSFADLIASNCPQPFISCDRLVLNPSNLANESPLNPTSVGVSSLEQSQQGAALGAPCESEEENLINMLSSGLIFPDFTGMETSQENT